MEFKESEAAKERSMKNKINAEKKKFHHVLGPGGYKTGLPKWDESEEKMIAAGVTPKIVGWPDRCRTWFYAHGGKLDPKTGEIIEQASLKEASDALLEAIEEALTGAFQPERERTTSLHATSRILNTRDEHEAKALFRGLRGLRTGTTLTKAV